MCVCVCVCARLLLLVALAGGGGWGADGEVVVSGGSGGVGPAFAPRQRSSAVAAVGQAASLDCRVLRLADKSVSWVRSSDLQILSHAGAVFTADSRVSATSGAAGAGGAGAGAGAAAAAGAVSHHTLRIERLRTADAGRYECQINTEPKMSLFFNLTVLDEPVPVVVVTAEGGGAVRARAAGAATLACSARYEPPPRRLPVPPLDIRWTKDDQLINLQSSRGGVSLDTERWSDRAVSRLTLAALSARDAGLYACAAGDARATLRLTVSDADPDEELNVMQRDQSAVARVSSAGRPRGRCWLALALAPLLAATARL